MAKRSANRRRSNPRQIGRHKTDIGQLVLQRIGARVEERGHEAVGAVRDALGEMLRHRPISTLGIAFGIGFLAGARWHR